MLLMSTKLTKKLIALPSGHAKLPLAMQSTGLTLQPCAQQGVGELTKHARGAKPITSIAIRALQSAPCSAHREGGS